MTVGRLRILVVALVVALVAAAPAGAQVPEPVIADGVTVAGVDVGGMTAAEATAAVQAFFAQPVARGARRAAALRQRRTGLAPERVSPTR